MSDDSIKPPADAYADGYYGDEDSNIEELDLSFLDEDEKK
jgi:hypothetical protein